MELYLSPTYMKDLDQITSMLNIDEIDHSSILVTGATGLIGSALVDLLLYCNKKNGSHIKIYAASRKPQFVLTRFCRYGKEDGLYPVEYNALEDLSLEIKPDYIIHAASNATPNEYITHPVDTFLANAKGIDNLLRYAVNEQVRKIIYVSSSEAYGSIPSVQPLREEQYGCINPLLPRSSYALGKQAAENLCIGYSNQYNCNVSIVRPGHIYGPTATLRDQRVSSFFAMQAAKGHDIVMKSSGSQIRSYCHCFDCASAILTVLLKGASGEVYNISNNNSIITIKEMASLLAQHGHVNLKMELPSTLEKAIFNPMSNSSLDSSKLEKLGWKGYFDASTGLAHTVLVLREILK